VRRTFGILLVGALIVLASGGLLIGVRFIAQIDPRATLGADYSCPDASEADVRVTGEFVDTDFNVPQFDSTVDIVIPQDWTGASALLADPGSGSYRRMMSCLLGRTSQDVRYSEVVDRAPEASIVAGHVLIHYSATESIGNVTATSVGFFSVSPLDFHTVHVDLLYPFPLLGARWSSVVVRAPGGRLYNTDPQPSKDFTKTSAEWAQLTPPGSASEACQMSGQCLGLDIDTGPHVAAILLANSSPWSIAAAVLGSATAIILGIWYYLKIGNVVQKLSVRRATRRILTPAIIVAIYCFVGYNHQSNSLSRRLRRCNRSQPCDRNGQHSHSSLLCISLASEQTRCINSLCDQSRCVGLAIFHSVATYSGR
jgi:hypothetical protein